MKENRKLLKKIVYILLLIIAIIILFWWYTTQNTRRMEERNKNYAADSARLKAVRIDEELNNALTLINTYTFFLDKSLTGPEVTAQMLREIESNSSFDAIRFTDINGITYTSDGRTSDTSERDYYLNGLKGESGISVIFSSLITSETMISFYSPVHYDGKIIGVLRGVYLAEEYLKDMLATTYFGEEADVFLCASDGMIISDSNENLYGENLLDLLVSSGLVDSQTAIHADEVFKNGGEGTFICDSGSKTDNICVMYLPENDYVLVQTFPKNVTQAMINSENLVGIQLEAMLIGLFIIYIIILLIQERQQKSLLEHENQEMGYIISGITTLFSRFIMVDFETDTYQYLAGTSSENNKLANSGRYQDFLAYISSSLISESARQEFIGQMQKDSIITALDGQNDLRFECHILHNGHVEWEHINIICLKRKDGNAKKILFIRQDITELKEKELRIQAEMARANRKERQYRTAITSNAVYTFDFNLTNDWIEDDIIRTKNRRQIYMLDEVGMKPPCKASEWFERQKQFIPDKSIEEYSTKVNLKYLRECFERGETETDVQYWIQDSIRGRKICVRQSFIMTKDHGTDDIIVMVVTKEITDSVRKQLEQTQTLKDALAQAQHANRAKNTFLSSMSHDIRTPMNAIIGFTTIALSHLDDKEQIENSLQNVLASSSQLLGLLDNVLNMSRIESGNIQIEEQACSISGLLHYIVDIIQPQAKAKQQLLLIDTFDVTDEAIIADSSKLNQIFINILSNAVKYTPAGGKILFQITQKTAFHSAGYGNYVFMIQDNGIGMSPKFIDRIFEPFERESSATKTGILGSGLGLAITKNIVDMMNGTISVQSEPGKGSTFTVELSLKLQGIEKNTDWVRKITGRRALILEHAPAACDSVSKMLRQIGMRPDQALSVSEALYRVKNADKAGESYYAYIIDWQKNNGLETVEKIRRAAGDDARIIILTANDWSEMKEDAKAAGVTAFCKKPIFMSDLKSALLTAENTDMKTDKKSKASSTMDFTGKRILLVEDILLNRKIAEIMLKDAGFSVEHAPDGTDAVDMVKASEEYYYDAILMDLQMPVMDGYEATKTIRALPRTDVKSIPIIAVTANALEEDKEAVLRCGMNAHVAKPLNRDSFIKTLEQFIK